MDKQTWQHIIDGDTEAYTSIYTSYFRKLFNYGRKFTVDETLIEDCIQEMFLDIWNKKEKMLEVESYNSYFYSSFRFILFKKIKSSGRIVQSNEFEDEPVFSSEYILIQKESDRAVQQSLQAALSELTPRQREAIFLRFYEGLTYEEVAAILDISVKATYKIMARSLLSLKEKMMLPLMVVMLLIREFENLRI
jgi:RNA polymerase sigma factor (sigma-70 family)